MISKMSMYEKGRKLSFFRPFLFALLLSSTSVISLPQLQVSDGIDAAIIDDTGLIIHNDFNLTPEPLASDILETVPEEITPKEHIPQESIIQETSESATETSPQGQTSISQNPISQEPISQSPISQEPTSQTSISQSPISQAAISQTSISQTSISQTSISQTSISQTSISQTSISQNPFPQESIPLNSIPQKPIPQNPISQEPAIQETVPQETALQEPATESRQEEAAPSSLSMNATIGIIGVAVVIVCISIYLIYKRHKRNLVHDRNHSEIDFSSSKKLSTFSENQDNNREYVQNNRYSQNSYSFVTIDDVNDNARMFSITSSLQTKALIPPDFTPSPLSSISETEVQYESNQRQLDSSIGQKEIKSIENRNYYLSQRPSSIKYDFNLRNSLSSVSSGSSESSTQHRDSLASDHAMISEGHHTSYLPTDFLSDKDFHDLANLNFALMNQKEFRRLSSVDSQHTITAPSGQKPLFIYTDTGMLGNSVYNPAAAFSQSNVSSASAIPNTTVHKSNTKENIEPILLKKGRKPPKAKKTMEVVYQPSPLRNNLA